MPIDIVFIFQKLISRSLKFIPILNAFIIKPLRFWRAKMARVFSLSRRVIAFFCRCIGGRLMSEDFFRDKIRIFLSSFIGNT